MITSNRRLVRNGLHPALVPILVGCATALVVALARRECRIDPASPVEAASVDHSLQPSEPVRAASPAQFPQIAQLQQIILASDEADSSDEDDRAFARHALRSLATNPLIGRAELAAARKLYDDHDYVAARNALQRLMLRLIERGQPIGCEEFDAARKLYDEHDYVAARSALQKLLFTKKNLPIKDHVLFYLAECNFQLGQYPGAQDGYDELLKEYPRTLHFDEAIRRLFAIGRFWLDLPKSASEVELADFTNEAGEERQGELREVYAPVDSALKLNFTDRSKPFLGTPGRGIDALRSVYMHDPSGPLADDALMNGALFHLRKQDFGESDVYFSEIRECYPKSKHLQAAYVLGAHACWKSYLQSRSDGKQLAEAKKRTNSALRLFPDAPWQRHLEYQLQAIKAEEIERANAAKAGPN